MPSLVASVYGLLAAATWGTGDFLGGVASKKIRVYSVILFSHSIGGSLVLVAAVISGEPFPAWRDFLWGMSAGIVGSLGVLALYRGLAVGRMGVVAPTSAVITALVPVIFGIFLEGWPGEIIVLGFAVAAAAVWLISAGDSGGTVGREELIFGLAAGLGFGMLFIFLDQITDGTVYWPLVGLRISSFSFILLVSRFLQTTGKPLSGASGKLVVVIIITGVCDAAGNLFFILATQAGRLDVASVLSSMYPAATVFLAWVLLREKLSARQWLGVGLAMLAVMMIAG